MPNLGISFFFPFAVTQSSAFLKPREFVQARIDPGPALPGLSPFSYLTPNSPLHHTVPLLHRTAPTLASISAPSTRLAAKFLIFLLPSPPVVSFIQALLSYLIIRQSCQKKTFVVPPSRPCVLPRISDASHPLAAVLLRTKHSFQPSNVSVRRSTRLSTNYYHYRR